MFCTFSEISWQRNLKPDVPPEIEPDNDYQIWCFKVPNNVQTNIPTKQKFSQTFEYDEFDGRVMDKIEFLCFFNASDIFYFILIFVTLLQFLLSLFVIHIIFQEFIKLIIIELVE